MTTSLRLRRGTTTQHSTFTGAAGEVTIDTTKNTIVVHDGSTTGGIPLAKESVITGAVRYDSAQTLNTGQKAQARSNIGAATIPASNGIVVQTASDTMTGRTITAGSGISIANGDGLAGNPTITNSGVLSLGGTAGAITLGSGLAMNAGALSCTVTGGVTSLNGKVGDITASQVAAAATSGYGYTPANPASYVSKDIGALSIGVIIHTGYVGSNGVGQGGTCPGSQLTNAGGGTWRYLSGGVVSSGYEGTFQRIA